MGPSGEMIAAPNPAPRNRRVGLYWLARAQRLPASKKAFTYSIWEIRMPSSPVMLKNALPNELAVDAPDVLALGSKPLGVMANSS